MTPPRPPAWIRRLAHDYVYGPDLDPTWNLERHLAAFGAQLAAQAAAREPRVYGWCAQCHRFVDAAAKDP